MPPEPLPWDRRDFRKHERSGSDPRFCAGNFGGGGPQRWREQNHHPHAPPPYHHQNRHQQQQRWCPDFRSSRPIPPGHGKQGSCHMYSDDAHHGYLPFGSRYGDRNFDNENPRPFASRSSDGRYFRNMRENRGSFAQKEWKGSPLELSASPIGLGRPITEGNNQRSVENTQTLQNNNSSKVINSSHPPDFASPSAQSQSHLKEQNDKDGGSADGPSSTSQKAVKENGLGSVDWKPLKWHRSGSLSSRGSGFIHSSSSKSMGVESTETVAEVQAKNPAPLQSPLADADICVSPGDPASLYEASSRKKPRLGWGEGLAKYENKKVDPEECTITNRLLVSINSTETMQSHAVNLIDKSPRVARLLDCASPTTPSSVACSSSPGIDEKESIKSVNNDDATKLSCSPCIVPRAHYDGPNLSLENLDLSSIAKLSTLINDFVRSNVPSPMDTGYMQMSSMNKLLVWKGEVLKALEGTESEIESLETELKSLIAKPRNSLYCASSSSFPVSFRSRPCEFQATTSKVITRPPFRVVSSGDFENKKDVVIEPKNLVVDSPGTATSKFVEVQNSMEVIVPSETAVGVEDSLDLAVNNSKISNEKVLDCADVETAFDIGLSMVNSSQDKSMHSDVNDHCSVIWASNKECANRALEELYKVSPEKMHWFGISTGASVSSLKEVSAMVKEKFVMRKQFIQFKEKVLALKFKVFRHFWKEGRVLSVRRLRIKSRKKFDLSGHKKNCSPGRSRISFSAGNPQSVLAGEVIEFVNNLLSEMPSRPCRNSLKMPALILNKKELKMSRFISNTGLMVDPCAVEKERSTINPWTAEETEIFIDKLTAFGKDFKKIASFLDNKTVADCIQFYYKNHKSETFERARKKMPDSMKQRKPQSTTYLVSTAKRWNRATNAASLDMLGATSSIAANVDDGTEIHQKCTSRYFFGPPSSSKASKGEVGTLQRSDSIYMYNNERETVAADVLAGICGSISSEAMSSCITSSVDPGDGYQDWRYQRVCSSKKRPLTPEVTQYIDDECSDESCWEMGSTDWTDEEKSIFVQAVASYGKDFVMISQSVRTKSRDECKVYFSKARKCLGLDLIPPESGGDVNGGDSDIEDVCGTETDSGLCNEGSGTKMKNDLAPPDANSNHVSEFVGTNNLKHEFKMCKKKSGHSDLDSVAAKPVIKVSPVGHRQMDDKPVEDLNMDHKEQNSVKSSHVPVQELGTTSVCSNTEAISVVEEEVKGLSEARKESEREQLLSPDENLNVEKVEDANSSVASAISFTISDVKSDPCVSHPSVGEVFSMQTDRASECQKKANVESCSAEKSHAVPLQENDQLPSVNSSTLFSVPIKFQRSPPHNALSANGPNMIYNTHSQNVALPNPVESLPILRGYPVSVHTKKQVNDDLNYRRSGSLPNVSKRDGTSHSNLFSLKKCSASVHMTKIPEVLFPSKEHSRDHSRPQSSGSSDVDIPPRNGDVKLFGKILTSSQSKSSSADYKINKPCSRSLNLKFNGDHKANSDSAQSKFDGFNFTGSENIPIRSCGFWDGNRIQTGSSQLPDSALLLTKYPTAFGNHAMHTVKLDQPSIPSSSNGVAECRVLRNREVQPVTIDMKQQQEVFISEMQRRYGLDVMSGMQQQARGMNVVGRGVLANGVSDPVAAIKMHYANAEQLNLQNGSILKEDDAWRSNGDLGR